MFQLKEFLFLYARYFLSLTEKENKPSPSAQFEEFQDKKVWKLSWRYSEWSFDLNSYMRYRYEMMIFIFFWNTRTHVSLSLRIGTESQAFKIINGLQGPVAWLPALNMKTFSAQHSALHEMSFSQFDGEKYFKLGRLTLLLMKQIFLSPLFLQSDEVLRHSGNLGLNTLCRIYLQNCRAIVHTVNCSKHQEIKEALKNITFSMYVLMYSTKWRQRTI